MITLGQVGLGYWGPNVLRNFAGLQQVRMKVCCDLDGAALKRRAAAHRHRHDQRLQRCLLTRRSRLWSSPRLRPPTTTWPKLPC